MRGQFKFYLEKAEPQSTSIHTKPRKPLQTDIFVNSIRNTYV